MAEVQENVNLEVVKTEINIDEKETTCKQEESDENNPSNDEFAYLKRDFSSEQFKIEVKRLPKYYGINEFRKLLNEKLKLASNKIKAPFRNSPYIFVCFRNEEDRLNAINVINDFKWKGKNLLAVKSKPTPDPLIKKRKDESNDTDGSKKSKLDIASTIKLSVTPLAHLPYEEQLEKKENEMKELLRKLSGDMIYQNSELKEWVEKQKAKYDGMPCEFLKIRSAEPIDGYRNKCEFTIGNNDETNLPTVGFRCGKYMDGSVNVAPVGELRHIPEIMKKTCEVFQEYVRNSDLKVFSPVDQSGHFCQLTARYTTLNQLMLIVGIHPQDLSEEKLAEFKLSLVKLFTEGPGSSLNVTSLYYQVMRKRKSNDSNGHEPELLHGSSYIYENLLGLKFRISPQAFFQVNTKGAELLYQSAIELAAPTEESSVIDICCGTGTIGLCFAKSCKKVIGVEIVPEAVTDAKENAKDNEITNSEFFAAKVEDVLSSLFYHAENDNVIAIVDPPRSGLHQKALCQLRNNKKLKKVVYISCNAKSAYNNFVGLARPTSKTLYGDPFVPVKAVAVDMFPHTEHCELVIFFQKYSELVSDA